MFAVAHRVRDTTAGERRDVARGDVATGRGMQAAQLHDLPTTRNLAQHAHGGFDFRELRHVRKFE
jgi:hypothetical protein